MIHPSLPLNNFLKFCVKIAGALKLIFICFVKDLSEKLFDWTNNRWIISFSKQKGEKSVKDEKKISQEKIIDKFKKSNEYDQLLKSFPDRL